MYKERVTAEMKEVFKEVPYGIEHTLKVLENAESIMDGENMEEELKELISIVAILHDIGAVEAQRKYGSMENKYQEEEGQIVAREILERAGYAPAKTDRACYIVGNHHTPSKIDGIDFQIQWEADLLENIPYMDLFSDKEKLKEHIDKNFKTATGRAMAYNRFL